MSVERDVPIPVRDGLVLRGDVFRPAREGRYPALITLSPYQKDIRWYPPEGHTAANHEDQCWETPDPWQWVPEGYAVIRVDARGSGKSPGLHQIFSRTEAEDYYDAIEWAARQPWCSGNVGATGISYYAMAQWRVAALQPPSLKAIVPWSGSLDQYREMLSRGGMMCHDFFTSWYSRLMSDHLMTSSRKHATPYGLENALFWFMFHELDGPFWRERCPDPSLIKVPSFGASSWGAFNGPGHVRGNFEAFKYSPAAHKKLRICAGSYFLDYYSEEGFQAQLRWLDYWLKGEQNGVLEEPRVRLAIRQSAADPASIKWRDENEWPLSRAAYRDFFIGMGGDGKGKLSAAAPSDGGTTSYDAPGELSIHDDPILGRVDETRYGLSFDTEPFKERAEIVGEIPLTVWMSSSYDDLDLHVFLSIVDRDGKAHEFSKGWLKGSRRRLDPERSTPTRPFHSHDRKEPLQPGVPVKLDVEIWPAGIVVNPGERIRLRLAGRGPGFLSDWHRRPRGRHTVHFGGDMAAVLKLPVID